MKSTVLKALLLPIAFLALGAFSHASAATCAASYTMTAVEAGSFSCTIGDLTFSNFAALYGTSGGATTPDPTLDVTVNFAEMTTGSDPFGTPASSSDPIYTVITDYTGDNSVVENQTLTGVVQYLVTDPAAGTAITEVDGAISGLAANTASGSLNKDICSDNQFEGGAAPNGACPSSVTIATSSLALTNPAAQESDGTPDFAGPFALSSLGVYDGWNLTGGSTSALAAANVTAVENDFIETTGLSTTPEPGTFVLLGGALVGFGLIRRRRKLA
jgi:hypothetical protein